MAGVRGIDNMKINVVRFFTLFLSYSNMKLVTGKTVNIIFGNDEGWGAGQKDGGPRYVSFPYNSLRGFKFVALICGIRYAVYRKKQIKNIVRTIVLGKLITSRSWYCFLVC